MSQPNVLHFNWMKLREASLANSIIVEAHADFHRWLQGGKELRLICKTFGRKGPSSKTISGVCHWLQASQVKDAELYQAFFASKPFVD